MDEYSLQMVALREKFTGIGCTWLR